MDDIEDPASNPFAYTERMRSESEEPMPPKSYSEEALACRNTLRSQLQFLPEETCSSVLAVALLAELGELLEVSEEEMRWAIAMLQVKRT